MTIEEIKELYKMIAERDDSIGDLISKIADKDKRIAELEALIGKLKCCGNCKHQHDYICLQECHNFDKWERRRCIR